MDIMKGLSELSLRSRKKDECKEASRLQKNMGTSEFVFLCVILSKILSEINLPSKLLQVKTLDLMTATESLQTASKHLKQYRNRYSVVVSEE